MLPYLRVKHCKLSLLEGEQLLLSADVSRSDGHPGVQKWVSGRTPPGRLDTNTKTLLLL